MPLTTIIACISSLNITRSPFLEMKFSKVIIGIDERAAVANINLDREER